MCALLVGGTVIVERLATRRTGTCPYVSLHTMGHLIIRWYSTRRASYQGRTVSLASVYHYAPLGAISAGATISTESAPHVHTRCSPLHAIYLPRMPAIHLEGKSLPSLSPALSLSRWKILVMHICHDLPPFVSSPLFLSIPSLPLSLTCTRACSDR